jgi:transposase-like protein
MVLDHESQHASRWAAVVSISAKIGCTPQTLHEWVKKAEIESGKRSGVPSDVSDRLKALERENRELRQANDILRKASAYFAMAELDRREKGLTSPQFTLAAGFSSAPPRFLRSRLEVARYCSRHSPGILVEAGPEPKRKVSSLSSNLSSSWMLPCRVI